MNLATEFYRVAMLSWLAFSAGVFGWQYMHKIGQRQLPRMLILSSMILWTCYGYHSVEVGRNLEAMAKAKQAIPVNHIPSLVAEYDRVTTGGGAQIEFIRTAPVGRSAERKIKSERLIGSIWPGLRGIGDGGRVDVDSD